MKCWPKFMLLLLFLTGTSHAALPREVSGSFYNPAQSGHGVTVEIASPSVAIVYWMVYDTLGAPMPLYIEGRIQGRRIQGKAFAPRGMRFGSFDRRDLTVTPWGDIELEFNSCSSATLRWKAMDPVFGEGSMPMTRLIALPLGSCVFQDAFLLPQGTLEGELHLPGKSGWLSGAVASDGKLYASTLLPESGISAPVIDRHARVVIAEPTHESNGVLRYQAEVFSNGFLCAMKNTPCPTPTQLLDIAMTRLSRAEVQAKAPADGSVLNATIGDFPFGPSDAFGRRRYSFDIERAFDAAGLLEFGDGRSLCVLLNQEDARCLYEGSYSTLDVGTVSFELTRVDSNDQPFRGVIRVDFNQVFIGPHRLRLIGSNGQTGLALAARTAGFQ